MNPKLSECELKEMKKHEKQLDELIVLKVKNEAIEVAEKDVKEALDAKKAMFHELTTDRIKKEAINNSGLYWLEPQTSIDVKNEMGCQFTFQ